MAKNKLAGITLEIGGDTTKLSDSLKEPNKEISQMQQKLKAVDDALKIDPTNIDLLEQKFRLLSKAIEMNEDKLQMLKTAQEQFIASGKDIDSAEYIELQRQIAFTTKKINDLRNQKIELTVDTTEIKNADNAVEDLDDSIKDVKDSSKNLGKVIAGAFAGSALAEQVNSIGESLSNVVEESKEYMKIMGALEVSSDLAGYSAKETAETFMLLYSVLADDQTSATTTANLQALGLSQQKLTELTYGVIGAWAKYGDSIPIDGLAESINETIKAGQVTGTFADVLNWASGSEDKFNEKLEKCKTNTQRANLVLQELSKQGLVDSANAFLDNNDALVENNRQQAIWQKNMAELSEMVLPILNDLMEVLNSLVEGFLNLPAPVQGVIGGFLGLATVITMLSPLIITISSIFTSLGIKSLSASAGIATAGTSAGGASVGFGALTASILPVIGAILGMIAVIGAIILVVQNWGSICDWFNKKWQQFTDWLSKNWKKFIYGFIEKGQEFLTFWATLPTKILSFIFGLPEKLYQFGVDIIRDFAKGIARNLGLPEDAVADVAEACLNAVTYLPRQFFNWGQEMIEHLGDGIASMIGWIGDKAKSIADTIASWLHFTLPDKGPLRKVPTWMPDMMKEMGKSIDRNLWMMEKPMSNLAKSMSLDFGGNVKKVLDYNEQTTINNPIQIDLDGKPIYQNVVTRITRTQGIRTQFKGAY